MRKTLILIAVLAAACSKETKAPEPQPPAPAPKTATTSAPVTDTTSSLMTADAHSATYDAGMEWFRTTRGFAFHLAEGKTRVEGSMVRPTPGAERVLFRQGSDEWVAASKRAGVVWYRKQGSQWAHSTPPAGFDRLFQRVTLYFDPQKREGIRSFVAMEKVGDEAAAHYTFTNANTGDVHDVWVSRADNRIAKMTISGTSDVTLTTQGAAGDVPNP